MPAHHLGRAPGTFQKLAKERKRELTQEIFGYLREGNVADTACWCAGVPPDEFRAECEADAHLHCAFMRELAQAEREAVRKMSEGGAGFSPARAAFESLKLTREAWTPKSKVDLSTELAEGLEALETVLDPKIYELVVKTLLRTAG